MRLALPILLLALSSIAAQAEESITLEPSSPWGVDWGADSCSLYRSFGEGENAVYFEMARFSPNGWFKISLAGKGVHPTEKQTRWAFEPDTELSSESPAMIGSFADGSTGIVFTGTTLSNAELAKITSQMPRNASSQEWVDAFNRSGAGTQRNAEITGIHVTGGVQPALRLHTGSLTKPLAAMNQCLDELLTHWGIDVAAHKSLREAAKPKGDPPKWVTFKDYPDEMLWKGMSSIVHFRLIVGADGSPVDCRIQDISGNEAFVTKTCEILMKRARFYPALDSEGIPIRSYYASTVQWSVY